MKTKFEFSVKEHVDESPDTSFLGEYSNTPGKVYIDREERGDMGRNEYRYFNLGCGDSAYIEQDYKRMEDLNKGYWSFIGIEVIASKEGIELGHASLWGIESNCGEEYKQEIIKDLTAEAQKEAEENLKKLCCNLPA